MTSLPDKSFSISEDVLSQRTGTDTVLLDMQGEIYFSLNEVGTRIWQLLVDGNGLEQLLSTLHCEYHAPVEQLRQDTEELLTVLLDKGLLTTK
jgi:hypothetical protein